MINELKVEIEKKFNRSIIDRGSCEALAQDIYEHNGIMISYNTLRRFFGLAEFRKPRESSLDLLANYCGFNSYKNFCHRFTDKNTWPTWERMFIVLSLGNTDELIDLLVLKKRQREDFSVSLSFCLRELITKRDTKSLLKLFREPAFQFSKLSYDEILQIGIVVRVGFRDFLDDDFETSLLLEPNFRDLVVKIFVDYSQLFGSYGRWITFLLSQDNLDDETKTFIGCVNAWRSLLMNKKPDDQTLGLIPELDLNQHPILFGRIFGIKILISQDETEHHSLINTMHARISKEAHLITELLYEPRVQSLVFPTTKLGKIIRDFEKNKTSVKQKYHFSHVAVHQVYQVSLAINNKQYMKATNLLNNIDQQVIRHSYQEFIAVYTSFFKFVLAQKQQQKNTPQLQQEFLQKRHKIICPLFTDAYFEDYFKA